MLILSIPCLSFCVFQCVFPCVFYSLVHSLFILLFYSLSIPSVITVYSLPIPCIFPVYSLSSVCLFPVYSLSIVCLFLVVSLVYSLSIPCLFPAVSSLSIPYVYIYIYSSSSLLSATPRPDQDHLIKKFHNDKVITVLDNHPFKHISYHCALNRISVYSPFLRRSKNYYPSHRPLNYNALTNNISTINPYCCPMIA